MGGRFKTSSHNAFGDDAHMPTVIAFRNTSIVSCELSRFPIFHCLGPWYGVRQSISFSNQFRRRSKAHWGADRYPRRTTFSPGAKPTALLDPVSKKVPSSITRIKLQGGQA